MSATAIGAATADVVTASSACQLLLNRYHRCLDERRATDAVEPFAADAVLEIPDSSASKAMTRSGRRSSPARHERAGSPSTW